MLLVVLLKEDEVIEAPPEVASRIKSALTRSPILKAVVTTLRKVYKEDVRLCSDFIIKEVEKMKIYEVERFVPLPTLRGAALVIKIMYKLYKNWTYIKNAKNYVKTT